MTNRQKGQIRVGQSGPIVVGTQTASNTQPPRIKVGQSGPIIVGTQNANTQPPQIRVGQSGSIAVGQQSSIVSLRQTPQIREQRPISPVQQLPPQIHIKDIYIKDIKKFVTEGYRKILLREPDSEGLSNHILLIQTDAISRDTFLSVLRNSEEYRNRFGSWDITNRGTKLIESNKFSNRPWFFGLQGTWWWELTEEEVRIKLEEIEKSPKIAIASIVRDEERNGNLGRFLDCCQELENYHNNIVYIFVEGDSFDRTYDVLKTWIGARDGSILEKMNLGTPHYPKSRNPVRTTILGRLRNRLIELIISMPNIAEVLMIDASYGWKGDIITSLRETGADIAAPLNVCHKDHNGNYVFYDIWTFRKNGREFGSFYPYAEGMAFDRPIDIDSAGGGYLIKRHVLDAGARYNGSTDCEHVFLCQEAKKKGFSIKINPKVYIRKGGYKE